MKNIRINILGLNYRDDPHNLQTGYCRTLNNLYPTGDVEKPIWELINDDKVIYQQTGREILWATSQQYLNKYGNTEYYVYFIDNDNNNKWELCYVILNDRYELISKRQVVYTNSIYLPTVYPLKISHTFLNGRLFVSVYSHYKYTSTILEVYIIKDVVKAKKFNIDDYIKNINIELINHYVDKSNLNLYLKKNYRDGYLGIRFALEYNDGTYLNITEPIYIKGKIYYQFDNGIQPFLYDIKLRNINWVKALSDEISGVAVFITLPSQNLTDILNGKYYHYFTFNKSNLIEEVGILIFSYINYAKQNINQSFSNEFEKMMETYFLTEQKIKKIISNKLLDVDNLSIYEVGCESVSSYNNNLLLLGGKLKFKKPSIAFYVGDKDLYYPKVNYLGSGTVEYGDIDNNYPNVEGFNVSNVTYTYDTDNQKMTLNFNVSAEYRYRDGILYNGMLDMIINVKTLRTTYRYNGEKYVPISTEVAIQRFNKNIPETGTRNINSDISITFQYYTNWELEVDELIDEIILLIDSINIDVEIIYKLVKGNIESDIKTYKFEVNYANN